MYGSQTPMHGDGGCGLRNTDYLVHVLETAMQLYVLGICIKRTMCGSVTCKGVCFLEEEFRKETEYCHHSQTAQTKKVKTVTTQNKINRNIVCTGCQGSG